MNTEPRNVSSGMGQAVFERTVARRKPDGELEVWADVAERVAAGNCSLHPTGGADYENLKHHIARGNTLMSGRHLQHGDAAQAERPMEVFTNCSTACTSFAQFYLMLNGSGVGRCYDDDMMLVDWDKAPNVRCVLDSSHPDFNFELHESRRDAIHKFGIGPNVKWFNVEDSREGWAKALEMWEVCAYLKIYEDCVLILDFSKVRARGEPIRGMQNRPASGPIPLMAAFAKAASIKGGAMPRWKQALYVDHYFAECVLVGGARRAARWSGKFWKDPNVIDFIRIKRPLEKGGLGFLWSSNNSICVNEDFWNKVRVGDPWATAVFDAACEAGYHDGTGEPGFVNVDRLVQNDTGWANIRAGDFFGSDLYHPHEDAVLYLARLARVAKRKEHHTIVNPCGEIPLNIIGGFCVIGDVVPYHCETLDEAEDCFRAVTRALIRVNLMPSVYDKEVKRTNRIGVGITGVHEFAWKFFGYGFLDLIDEAKSQNFWLALRRFNLAVRDEAIKYSKLLGVDAPHTCTTVKPSGSVSKLFALTEGWHLPSMREFLRWVQFRNGDPIIGRYITAGYPARELKVYEGTTIIGFPTSPAIVNLGMGDKLVTAAEATPAEQFQWLKLGEKYWIEGTDHTDQYGGQISYTLKYNPDLVGYDEFRAMILEHQSQVRCCSVMPQSDTSSYEYQPEEPVSAERFAEIVRKIVRISEDVGREHIDCASGACPIDFNGGQKI